MIRIALLLLALTGTAMAKPLDPPAYPGPVAPPQPGEEAPPSKTEMMMYMWRQYKGDEPMPESMRRKYGIPADPAQSPQTRR
jgi:hypothetical protein